MLQSYFGKEWKIVTVNTVLYTVKPSKINAWGELATFYYDKVSASASYGEFVKKYTEQYVHEQDRQKLQEFLASEKLTEHLVDGCMEEDMRDSIDLTDLDIRMD